MPPTRIPTTKLLFHAPRVPVLTPSVSSVRWTRPFLYPAMKNPLAFCVIAAITLKRAFALLAHGVPNAMMERRKNLARPVRSKIKSAKNLVTIVPLAISAWELV